MLCERLDEETIADIRLALNQGQPLILEISATMANDKEHPSEQRRQLAMQIFKEHPDKIPLEIQEKILANQVVLGMAPYDAYLAAGAFAFKVIADPAKWKSNADPYQVMWAQSLQPDDSQIWMTFRNDTQYAGEGAVSFRVFCRGGRVLEIEKLKEQSE